MECYTSCRHVNVRREKVIQQSNVTRQHLTLEEKKLFNSGMLHVMLTLEEKKLFNSGMLHVNI